MEEVEDNKNSELTNAKYRDAWRHVLGAQGQRNDHQNTAFEHLDNIIRGRVYDNKLDHSVGCYNEGGRSLAMDLQSYTIPRKEKQDINIQK